MNAETTLEPLRAQSKWLREVVKQMREEGQHSWANTCEEAADAIDAALSAPPATAQRTDMMCANCGYVDESRGFKHKPECHMTPHNGSNEERELDAERQTHDEIATLCFENGASTDDGTSLGAVRGLVANLKSLRNERDAALKEIADAYDAIFGDVPQANDENGQPLTVAEKIELLSDERAAARQAETERCCKAMCTQCRRDVPITTTSKLGAFVHMDSAAWVPCYASAIRATTPSGDAPPSGLRVIWTTPESIARKALEHLTELAEREGYCDYGLEGRAALDHLDAANAAALAALKAEVRLEEARWWHMQRGHHGAPNWCCERIAHLKAALAAPPAVTRKGEK